MALSQWKLPAAPFADVIEPRTFFATPASDEALARMQFLVDAGRRVGLLLGPPGAGKSTILEYFAQQQRRAGRHVAKTSLLGLDVSEFLGTLASAWGQSVDARAQPFELWRLVGDCLALGRRERIDSVVLLDDADSATTDVLAQVGRLAQYDPSADARLTLLLACAEHRLRKLGERLLEQAELRIDLAPWNASEVSDYVNRTLDRAAWRQPRMSDEALAKLTELAGGIPRHVNQLAHLSLVAAAAQHFDEVDAHTVETVYAELGVVVEGVTIRG